MTEGVPGSSVPDSAWAPPAADAGRDAIGLAGYSDFVEIARGGDSVVYRARQNALDRFVAVKTVEIEGTSGGARFTRELEITLGLGRQHPHIVTVLDTGTTADGRAAIVMEYHELGSLHDRLVATGPLPVADVVKAAAAVADALDFAHSHGVLHRDVKPQNILVLPTSYVLADFGVARMADAGHTASLERFSYRHASPQVLDGVPPTAADDIWSLGSTVFTLLDGRAPFAADDPADDTALAYLGRVRRGERRQLRRDDLPQGLAELIDLCLDADPARRPVMADLRRRLGVLASEQWAWQPGATTSTVATDAAVESSSGPAGTARDEAGTPVSVAAAPPVRERQAGAAAPSAAALETPTPTPVEPATPAASAAAAPAPSVPVPAEAPPPSEPPPPSAQPLAPAPSTSALAHLDERPDRAGRVDDEPTGLAPRAEPAGPPADDPPRRAGLTRFRLIAFVVVATLIGVTVGVLAKVAGSSDEQQSPPVTTSNTALPVPSVSTPVASVTSKPYDLGNPRLAPQDLQVTDRGSSLQLTWKDQTDGKATFVVVDVTGSSPNALQSVAAGSTSTTVEGIDPAAPQVCIQLAAILGNGAESGATRRTCVTRD